MNINFDTIKELGLAQSQSAAGSNSQLGQAQFLELMTTQLKNQNPLKPLESGDFLGQIAQFSTVSGIQDLQKSFTDFSGSLSSDQALQAANLVGRSVLVPSDEAILAAGGAMEGEVTVPLAASSVKVNILNTNGERIRTLDLGAQPPGQAAFVWDGALEDGSLADPGAYRVEAVADTGGESLGLQTQVRAEVESVTLGGLSGGLKVNLTGLGGVRFNEVLAIL